jgi:uncharacterized protein involved in exopolysaccharide biosynthesis
VDAGDLDRAIDSGPPLNNAGFSLLSWAKIVLRWRKLVATTALGFAVMGCVLTLLLPARYTASAVLLPPQQSSSEGTAIMAQLSNLGGMAAGAAGLGIKNPNDQQVAMLKSRTVEDAMVERFHLQQVYGKKYLSSARKLGKNDQRGQWPEGRSDPHLSHRQRSPPGRRHG